MNSARSLVEATYEHLPTARIGLGWIGGLTGVTWALRRLVPRLDGSDAVDQAFSEVIDDALLAQLGGDSWHGQYDLVSGLVGTGLYGLEHPERTIRERLTGEVLRHLNAMATRTPQGTAWFTPPELLTAHQRVAAPDGHYNLGLAHGVPGIIGFLTRCVEQDCHADQATSLLQSVVQWMLAQGLNGSRQTSATGRGGLFPNVVGEDRPARLAWCYGDLGICIVLLRAADALARDDWRAFALQLARDNAGRRDRADGVHDLGLCHGTAGAALGFLRLWQRSGDAVLADAACYWVEQTLAMRDGQFERTAGVFSVEHRDGTQSRIGRLGYLTGAAGVGLALLSCLTQDDDAWDAPLLTDLPASHGAVS